MAVKFNWHSQLADTEEEFNSEEAQEMVPELLRRINELEEDVFRLSARLRMALNKMDSVNRDDS